MLPSDDVSAIGMIAMKLISFFAACLLAAAPAQSRIILEQNGSTNGFISVFTGDLEAGDYRLSLSIDGADSGGYSTHLNEYRRMSFFQNGQFVEAYESPMADVYPLDATYQVTSDTFVMHLNLPAFRDYLDSTGTGSFVEVLNRSLFLDWQVQPFASGPRPYRLLVEQIEVPVPEPGSWALLILGFGVAGSALRSRVGPLPSQGAAG